MPSLTIVRNRFNAMSNLAGLGLDCESTCLACALVHSFSSA